MMMMDHKMPTTQSITPRRLAHTPAWKRIGLKLKLPQMQSYSLGTVIMEDNNLKRKAALLDCDDNKERKVIEITTDDTHQNAHEITPLHHSVKKSVKFTPETKVEDGDSIKKLFNIWNSQQKSQRSPNSLFKLLEAPKTAVDEPSLNEEEKESRKARKRRRLKDKKASDQSNPQFTDQSRNDIPPFLSYLKEYHESQETWKFKKNHQTHLLQHVFDVSKVPSNFAHLIYAYVRGLKGQVRTRLRDTAIAVIVEDKEKGADGFPSEILNLGEKQKEYEDAIVDYMSNSTTTSIQQDGHEESFLSKFEDVLMRSRLVKRMRAERIIIELAFSPEGSGIASPDIPKDNNIGKINSKSSNSNHKKVRRRKKRTAIIEESSSDSDSDSVGSDLADANSCEAKPIMTSSTSSSASSPELD